MSLPLIRAELYYYWCRYNDAVASLGQLLTNDFLELHQPDRALEAARSMVSAEPDVLLHKSELVPCVYVTGNIAEAARVMERVLHPHSSDFVDANALATMYARIGFPSVSIPLSILYETNQNIKRSPRGLRVDSADPIKLLLLQWLDGKWQFISPLQ